MIKVCFVILHYNTIEITRKCIASIQKLEEQDKIAAVIVDNASPDGTGKVLADQYRENDRIKVILRETNDGFSAGNNEGCAFAMTEWNPEFLVVANNDIEFCQADFVRKIEQEYKNSSFDILGPDICNPKTGNHQSPISINPPGMRRVNKTIFLNQCALGLYPVIYPAIKKYFSRHIRKGQAVRPLDYQEDVCLLGACFIFSRKCIMEKAVVFQPETKFYYEEFILTSWCRRHGRKIVYQPKLQVWHQEGKATETTGNCLKEQFRFLMENILNAAKVYREFLREKGNVEE